MEHKDLKKSACVTLLRSEKGLMLASNKNTYSSIQGPTWILRLAAISLLPLSLFNLLPPPELLAEATV